MSQEVSVRKESDGKAVPLFSADKPITTGKQDWLGRINFAKNLATAISEWSSNEGFVIALFGPWGSGKSSIKNLCLELLREQQEPVKVLDFQPWLFSTEEELFNAFFRDLEILLQSAVPTAERTQFSKEFKYYVTTLKVASPVSVVAAGMAAIFLPAIAPFIVAAAPLIKGVLDSGVAAMDAAVKSAEELEKNTSGRTIVDIKEGLHEILKNLEKPVLVILDDIDRLTPKAMNLLFQLVKVNADFPNVLYLVCCEREVVEKALKTEAYEGRDYLEKLVQVSFHIPFPAYDDLHQKLETDVQKLIERTWQKDFDKKRWEKLFPLIRPFFKTPRTINRYVNALKFNLNLFRGSEANEINPIDLIALEVLRLCQPEFYETLHESKSIIFDVAIKYKIARNDRNGKMQLKEKLETVFAKLEGETKGSCKNLFFELFRHTAWLYDYTPWSPDDDLLMASELRICDELSFDRYFLYRVPNNDISQASIEELLKNTGDGPALFLELRKLVDFHASALILSKLDMNLKRVSLEDPAGFVEAILTFTEDQKDYSLATSMIARYVALLQPDTRLQALLKAFASGSAPLSSLILMRRFHQQFNDNLFPEDAFKRLAKVVAKNYEKFVVDTPLPVHPSFLAMIFSWGIVQPRSTRKIRAAVLDLTKTDEDFWVLLELHLGTVIDDKFAAGMSEVSSLRMSLGDTNIKWAYDWFEKFYGIEKLHKRTKRLVREAELTERQKSLLNYTGTLLSLVAESEKN
ncbi:MAG: AAA family ATPase [Cyanobacteria bacterium SZAS-4]|nr:AAA family ATPase [Cyanobacteria bacterium SZAS-4]